MRARRLSLASEDGITAVEMLVAITLTAVAMAVLMSIFISTQSTFTETRATVVGQGDARAITNLITQELRSAGSDPASINVQRLGVASTNFVRVQSDINGDGILQGTEPAEDILYFYMAGTGDLWRITPGGNMVVLRDLKNFRFQFMDAAGDTLGPTPLNPFLFDQVRSVRLLMTHEPPQGVPHRVDTVITMRNS